MDIIYEEQQIATLFNKGYINEAGGVDRPASIAYVCMVLMCAMIVSPDVSDKRKLLIRLFLCMCLSESRMTDVLLLLWSHLSY